MEFTFAELLRGYRRRASLDQAMLASSLRVHINTLSGWERGRCRPRSRELVLRLAAELALSPSEIDMLLCAADFPAEHGSLMPQSTRHQLRSPIADFVGRTQAAAQITHTVQAALDSAGGAVIVGVQGMGGIGKTEFAYLVAQRLNQRFPDAQIVVPLQGTSAEPLSAAQALRCVIHAITPDAKLPGDLPGLQALYRSVLHGQRALILADDACDAAQVRPLLPPLGCALVVTSRQRFTLPGMATVYLEQLAEDEAVALLQAICAHLDRPTAQAIAQVCGYLPLALRISASLLHNDPALAVADYLADLSDQRRRLAQLRDPDDPQLDVGASLALSYARLNPELQQVFRQLGVFVSDFTLPLALAALGAPDSVDGASMLRSLLRCSLVIYSGERDRWQLHDLVRDLARQALELHQELDAAQWRYAEAVVQMARAIQAQYAAGGSGLLLALAQFDRERPHLDAARAWAEARAGTPRADQLMVALALALSDISNLRCAARDERLPQWQRVLAAALRLGDQRCAVLAQRNIGISYEELGDIRRALPYYEQALSAARDLGDQAMIGSALNNLGLAHISLGEPQRAILYFEQRLTMARALASQQAETISFGNLGTAYTALGDVRRAAAYLEHALAGARATGLRRFEGYVLGNLGRAYADLGDLRRANEACAAAIDVARALADQRMEGYALSYLALAQAYQGQRERATATFVQAMVLLGAAGDRWGEAEAQWLFGLMLVHEGAWLEALALLRATVAYEQEIGHAQAALHADIVAQLERAEDPSRIAYILSYQHVVGSSAFLNGLIIRFPGNFPLRIRADS